MCLLRYVKGALNLALYARKKSGHKDTNSRKYWQNVLGGEKNALFSPPDAYLRYESHDVLEVVNDSPDLLGLPQGS